MRRATLGTLNIGNQPRQVREKKVSLGARPSTGGRLSTSGRPSSVRRSSQYGRDSYSAGQVVKDPRPLTDRGYQQKMIRYLMEFLTEFNYSHPLSNRVLSAPPMKEFKKIFLFIYKYINNNRKDMEAIEKKPEEEIPKILKMLGYPFTISKSSMFSVGSPHTWPNLLGALCWLIEVIRFSVTLSDNDNVLFPDDECDQEGAITVSFDKCYFGYLEKTYTAFLKGRDLDNLEDFDEDFYQQIRSMNAVRYKEMEELESENNELEQELARLEGKSRLKEVMQQKKSLIEDEDKFRKYISDLKRSIKKMDDNNGQVEEEIGAIRMELEAITKENNHLQDQLNRQELSPADVERLKKDKQGLVKLLQQLEKHRDHIDQQIWEREMQFAKAHEEMANNTSEYNDKARQLKLIPASAANARGIDFEIRFNPMSKQPDMELQSDFKGTIKNALVQLRQQIAEKTRELQSQLITEEEALDQVSDMAEAKMEETAALESKMGAFDKEQEWKKEVMHKEFSKATEDLQRQENKVLQIKQQMQQGIEQKELELREAESWAEQRLTEREKEKQEYSEFLGKACHLIMNHKSAISKRCEEVRQVAEQQLEETRAIEVPKITIKLDEINIGKTEQGQSGMDTS